MAKKKKQTKRVASLDPTGVLVRDLKSTALWIGIAVGFVTILNYILRTFL